MFDDLGYNDLGCYYQPTPDVARIDTPHIDRLATQGVRFTQFYSAAAACTPSRAALMTGCYPPRVGLSKTDSENGAVLDMQSRIHLSPNDVTIAEILKSKGYATACVGKWHLGHEGDGLPTRHGFDDYYGAIFRRQEGNLMLRGEKPTEAVADADLTSAFTHESIAFIKRNQSRPFFLLLSHWMPHTPLASNDEWRGKSARGLYGDVVAELDWSVGEIMATLDELGLREHTIVMVTSDNGPARRQGDDGGSCYPLRGGKLTANEGGFRVPFIVSWFENLPEGKTCSEIATLMDVLPTMVSITGAYTPKDLKMDGHNMLHLLRSPDNARSAYEAFYYYDRNELEAVRAETWKLIFPRSGGRDRRGDFGLQLYNLANDPGERDNTAANKTRVVARLEALADRMREDLGDDNLGIAGKNRGRPGGVADEATAEPYEFKR